MQVELPEFRIEAKVQGLPDSPVVCTRTFRIDERIDSERVKAEYKEGALRVHVPKSAAYRPPCVEVQSS
ncbi:MAG: Hsp20/alpha crystallin family protein [Polyangiaceae bacterium]